MDRGANNGNYAIIISYAGLQPLELKTADRKKKSLREGLKI